jgi:sec-independent protein translocase protein TatB
MSMPPPIAQANLGMADTMILMVMALVVFGPRRLPQIGRQIGKLMYEFRKASNEFKWQMEEELRSAEDADRRKRLAAEAQSSAIAPLASAPAAVPEPSPDPSTSPSPSPSVEPRILPPSTGTPVATSRPGSESSAAESATGESTPAAEPEAQAEPPSTNPGAVTEQAAHHG